MYCMNENNPERRCQVQITTYNGKLQLKRNEIVNLFLFSSAPLSTTLSKVEFSFPDP
jgi:hypothetical protein